jgi:hypothetical protein
LENFGRKWQGGQFHGRYIENAKPFGRDPIKDRKAKGKAQGVKP